MSSVGVQDEIKVVVLAKEQHELCEDHQVSFCEEMRIVGPVSVEERAIRVELNG